MDRPNLPLNALRAFEVAARQGSFTQAAIELRVSQAAVSHQIKGLEDLLGVQLFTRTPKGLLLTDEAMALFPVINDSLDRVGRVLDGFLDGRYQETLHVGVVTTFAVGWLMPQLAAFRSAHPGIDLRIWTNNNRVDISKEGLDMAIRFGAGRWSGMETVPLMEAPLTPLCSPRLAEYLQKPADLHGHVLLRSYRADEWPAWFDKAGTACPNLCDPIFDSSIAMADISENGAGVALLSPAMFAERLETGRLVAPFPVQIETGRYWLTYPAHKPPTPAMISFQEWVLDWNSKESPQAAPKAGAIAK
ncbi:LysR family transcriptional regulator [Leisingera methylohalidivorans]|uniref:LysR family transcriptional regulator n=1 Tax=Leisingera methylohalidivorans DSM 14336 TaxID=999552 RepID=V9VYT3_9RHOB|nr:LysR family transcriptional regulator [Leisingera methylohalidivorans]AHD03826.1 LysR family transcriptional regulator [Leisingera methylohalidivorans DSM 14336]